MGDLLTDIHHAIKRNRWKAIFGLLLLVAGLTFLLSRLQFEEDISRLIPVDEENQELQEVLSTVRFKDKIIVNISRSGEGTVDELTDFAAAYYDSLTTRSGTLLENVQGRAGDRDIQAAIDFSYAHLPFLLEENDYDTIATRLGEQAIRRSTQANFRTLLSPSGMVARKGIQRDPLGLTYLGLEKLRQLSVGEDFELLNGFVSNPDHTNVLLFLDPKSGSSETELNGKLVDFLNELSAEVGSEYGGRVTAEIFGSPVVAVANARQIKQDIHVTVSIAMGLLLIGFIFFYRSLAIPLILFLPTALGAAVAMAFLSIVRESISAISLGIGAVLIGITLDYSLHILTHLRAHPDVKRLYRDVAKPVLMSSLTTGVAFCCLLFIRSQALQDLGIFAAVSVVSSAVFALILMPLLYRTKGKPAGRSTLLDRLAAYPMHKNKVMVALLLVVTLVCFFKYDDVFFETDLAKMNYFPQDLQDAEKRLDQLSDFSSASIYLTAYDDSLETALGANERLFSTLDSLRADERIGDFRSIGGLLLSKATQEAKWERWRGFWTAERRASVEQRLVEAGSEVGFKPSSFDDFYAMLSKENEPMEPADLDALPMLTISDFLSHGEGLNTLSTLVRLKEGNEEQLKELFRRMDHVLVIDRKEMNEQFLGKLKVDFNRLVLYSLIAVTLILFLFFRNLPLVLVTLIPVCLTWFMAIGLMAISGIPFTIFSIIISTFIFGLGIDYSIFITNGLLSAYRTGLDQLRTYRTSILLSLITTILGVGVLIFAEHPALYSIATVCMIGVASAVLMAFTIQPLLFRLLIGGRDRPPSNIRELTWAIGSFLYYGTGGVLLSIFSVTILRIFPKSGEGGKSGYHRLISKFLGSVLYTNPFVSKKVINKSGERFDRPAMIIANHSSFLDILSVLMLDPRIIILVNDWVYDSPIFGQAVKKAGFYPVSKGADEGVTYLRSKVEQGYNIMAFPEGTRSLTNRMRRFHKGAFFLAEELDLDVIPVLIHGNSEVLPKGDFIIKDGRITIEIMERISKDDSGFGSTSRERTKGISRYFKQEYREMRNRSEDKYYFHRSVRDHFRFAEDRAFKEVKKELEQHAEDYHHILRLVEENEEVIHCSNGHGQLALLLCCDAPARHVHALLASSESREFLRNGYQSPRMSGLSVHDSLEEMSQLSAKTLIVEGNSPIFEEVDPERFPTFDRLIVIGVGQEREGWSSQFSHFAPIRESERMTIFETQRRPQ